MGDVWERLLRERGYKILHPLGEGAYSKVKLAYSSRLSKEVAIKCINKLVAPRDFVEKFLPRELQALPHLRHEHIVRVYEILESSDGYVYIIMEAARNGDMLRYVQKKGALPENEVRKYFKQLSLAIKYCHSLNICHRDLKCENLLLDKDNKLLLTDFGFSKSMIFDAGKITLSTTFCGSAAYAAPEIIRGRAYDPRMHDIWSMGVILYIMTCGHMPFDDSNVRKMLKVQLRNNIKFPPRVAGRLSEEVKDLIRKMIQPDVTRRITVDEILRHPFLNTMEARPSSGSNPVVNVTQHIYDFFAGRPSSSQEPMTSANISTEERQRYTNRKEAHTSRRRESSSHGCSHNKRHATDSKSCDKGGCCNGSVSTPTAYQTRSKPKHKKKHP